MDDLRALEDLGQEHDGRTLSLKEIPGDEFYESTDLNEYPVELLKLKQCRSFRADLRHKLTIIIRACGGYGNQGVWKAASRLRVHRKTLWTWLRFSNCPKSIYALTRIDSLYQEALQKLVAEKTKKR